MLDPRMCTSHLILNTDLAETTCLRFIGPVLQYDIQPTADPNSYRKLKSALEKVQESQIKDHLQRVIALAEKRRSETRTYLKFCGD
jgi:hypothetical protein